MITGFEEYTKDLTEYERDVLLPVLIKGLEKKIEVQNAIISKVAIAQLKAKGYKISGARWRKLMHVIRVSGMVKRVVATSNGYYITNELNELAKYNTSLTERIAHITSLKDALKDQADEFRTENQTGKGHERGQAVLDFD